MTPRLSTDARIAIELISIPVSFPDMPLHLIKLCVGANSVDDLAAWIDFKLQSAREAGLEPEQYHTTRMIPKRADELLAGGSLYWVIKGFVQARQRLLEIRPFTDDDGIGRCRLVLEPVLHATELQPRRPFQGWRYLKPADAPRDLARTAADAEIPFEMRRDLSELCLL